MIKKLYEIKLPITVNEEFEDGSKFFIVKKLDGMYSFCVTQKGSIVHLFSGTELEPQVDGTWNILDRPLEEDSLIDSKDYV